MPGVAYPALRAYQKIRVIGARARARRADWRGLRILGYHRLSEDPETLSVSPARFKRQLELALGLGAQPIRLSDALHLLERPTADRYLAVTFDDGYRDNVSAGEAILRDLGVPATIFLPTEYIDGTRSYDWYASPTAALSWEDVVQARDRGVFDFQSHSRSHRWLTSLNAAGAWDEIAGSKQDIETKLGTAVTLFAYPAGMYSQRDVELLRRAGYRGAVATKAGVNRHGSASPLELRRTLLYWEDGDEVAALKLRGALDKPPLARALYYRVIVARHGRRPASELPRRRAA